MLIRKKALKIQERLGMRIGVAYGTSKLGITKTPSQVLEALRDLYKIGLKAFVLPKELFSGITNLTDLYKDYYGELLRIKTIAKKFNIELALHHSALPEQPDDQLKILLTVASVMDCRTFVIHPTFYKRMPFDQALRLIVYKVNEILTELRTTAKLGIETTGKLAELGSLEDVIEICKRTTNTEPILNFAHIHARGVGCLKSPQDFRAILDKVRIDVGKAWLTNAYFFFSGIKYGPSGELEHISFINSDLNLQYLIREIISFGIKGTLIFEDPNREQVILKILDRLGDMVR